MSDNDLSDVLDGVDLQAVEVEERSFEPLPAGDYLAQAVEGGVVRKDNGNAMIKLTFEILDGEYEHRKLWVNLNIRNANPTAQRIATEQLTGLWRDALGGKGNPPDVESLLFRPVVISVALQKRKDTGALENQVRKYRPANGAPPPAKNPAPTTPAPAGGSRPSWLKKTG